MQNVFIGCAHGVGQEAVTHETAVDVKILHVATGSGCGGLPDEAIKSQAVGTFTDSDIDRKLALGELFAQYLIAAL